MGKAKAKADSIAAEIQRATLQLERMVALRGERAADNCSFACLPYQYDIMAAAQKVGHAKDRAFTTYGTPRSATYPPAVERALLDANAAITRAYPLTEDML
jgi:hypothetical protein